MYTQQKPQNFKGEHQASASEETFPTRNYWVLCWWGSEVAHPLQREQDVLILTSSKHIQLQ